MRRWIFAWVFIFLTFILSLWSSHAVFEQLPHLEDELAYLHQAQIFADGDIIQDSPQPRNAFWKPFVIDFQERRFSKYSPGWSMGLAIGVLLGRTWVINAYFGMLTVALVYRLATEIYNHRVGLFAAFLLTFSPMMLLLNGSLMSHTSAHFAALLFIYSLWRIEQGKHTTRWGLLGGIGLGLLVINRTLTALAIATPFIIYSLLRLLFILIRQRQTFKRAIAPLIALSLITLMLGSLVPLYRWAATGSPAINPYELVWSYDKVGFCDTCGRSGHTLEKGIRHAAQDLTLTVADLFGWQWTPLTMAQKHHLLYKSTAYPGIGYSWILLPFGLFWGIKQHQTRRWTILLASVPLCLIGGYVAYWVGSQRYSTRYYAEAIGVVAILSAIPLGYLSRYVGRWLWVGLIALTLYTGTIYTYPRLMLLHGFNGVSQSIIDAVNQRRQTDRPVLVILTETNRPMTWRANGSLMAVTSANLDSDIVLARDKPDQRYREQIIAQFPNHEIIDMYGSGSKSWFAPPQEG